MGAALDPVITLMNVFCMRKAKNPQYSLRAYARDLNITPGRMSEVLSRKRKITLPLAKKCALGLQFSPSESKTFLASVEAAQKSKHKKIQSLLGHKEKLENESDCFDQSALLPYAPLPDDAFSAIADWYHFAILSLIETQNFREDETWISSRLGISNIEVRAALERLKRLQLVATDPVSQTLVLTNANLSTPSDVASVALRKSHMQSLEQSMASLENTPLDLRDITAMTMAIDVAKIPLAKQMIRDFRRRLAAVLETDSKTEVYSFNLQLIPISKKELSK